MSQEKLLISWEGLVQLGWPLSRTHTWRLMKPRYVVYRKRGTVREIVSNPRQFPQCVKLGPFANSRPVWRYKDVIKYIESYGIVLTDADHS